MPDKPSIAVLPFQNRSGDPEQEYFADGLAQEAEAHAQLALRLSPRGYGIGTAVCTENLNADVVMMKSAEYRV